ncbi:MAG: hypothetical protein JW863_12020 [Chitinispirillaceae bacterium]|nr:hypothetical protein [Chitinispirillaceae bacterium]
MKCRDVVLVIFLSAVFASAGTALVETGNVLNLYSLQKTQLKGTYYRPWSTFAPPCSLNVDTLKRYDFVYQCYDFCTCICPCCPEVRITSPRAFYRSNAPMNFSAFNPSLLATNFTKISGPDSAYAGGLTCSTLPSVTYGHTGTINPTPIDSMESRLFVFLSDNGGALPFYLYMLVHIDTVLPYQFWCNPNEPNPGGQYYPLSETARISIYAGPIASIKKTATPAYARVETKDLNLFTIFGKRIDNHRIGELPAGIYIVNGRLRFLQKNAPLYNVLNSLR